MSEQRVGLGIDLHRFSDQPDGEGRELVLGGVAFERERPLIGHSDADALAHALMDALFGAAGLCDIGEHFPDDDPAYAGADSIELLRRCVELIAKSGWRLVNADATVITERPRLAPVREAMIERLSAAAGGPVHVKATTPERLGSLGRAEGLACMVVALIER